MSVMDNRRQHFARLAVARGPVWLILSLLTGLVLAGGILFSGFDTSLAALLTQSDPYLNEVEELDEKFPSTLQVTYAIVNPVGSVFDQETLSLLETLQQRFRDIPFATRISTLLNYRSPDNGRQLFARPLQEYDPETLRQLEQDALGDPLLTANLLSANARLTFANITLDSVELDSADRLDVANAVLLLHAQLQQANPALEISVSSDVLFEQSTRAAMISDLTWLLPFVILICVATICYCFHSFAFGFCILSQALLTVVSTVGALGYLGLAFNSVSVIAPLVVVIIAVAHSVHIISIYKQRLHSGLDYRAAMTESIVYNIKPITLATVTTAIGFLSLNLCSSPAIQDFGRIVALGISFALIFTFSLLPSLLIWISKRIPSHGRNADAMIPRRVINLAKWLWMRFDQRLFIGFTALAIVTALLLPLNETDFNRLDFIPRDSILADYYDSVGAQLNRGPALTYGIDTGQRDGAITPEFLQQVDSFAEWLRQQDEIESVASLVEVVKTIYRARGGQDPDYYRIPADVNAIAMDLSIYASIELDEFPLDNFIDLDFTTIRLFVNALPMSNQDILTLDEKLSTAFAGFFPDARLIHGSGLLLFARMDDLVTVELLRGYSLSLLLITLTLVTGFRSLYFGILSVIPNLLPATMVFGLWGLFVGQLDPFVMMLFSISIGLVVDDTVHILSHYLDNRKQGLSIEDAVNRSLDVAGPALVVTTLVLALGTTLLIAASTLYFQQAAKLLVPIVLLALVLDLLFLPTILKRFDRGHSV
ncbi:MAG: MMPL family transporter [Pseudohongiellaceae bacterium]